MRCLLVGLLLLASNSLFGVNYQHLADVLNIKLEDMPFNYNIAIRTLKGKSADEPIMLCFHGYGSSNRLVDTLKTYPEIEDHLVSFNFPDFTLRPNTRNPENSSFGTIQEILTPLYILKKLVIDGKIGRIDLYGFSAGGGALINTVAILNSDRFQDALVSIGISLEERKAILQAILKGYIILDVPLKSIDELVAFRGNTREFEILKTRYRENEMVPIDALSGLDKLPLKILLNFQNNDEALSNRDDDLYINRLRKYNRNGITCVVKGNDGGHVSYHKSLWKMYPEFISEKCGKCCILEYGN